MDSALYQLFPLVVPFLMVLFRVAGLFVFVPVFSNAAIPGNVRALLAVAVSACLWPMVPKTAVDTSLIGVTVAIVAEMSVGFMIGILTSLVYNGIQLGGHLISQQMGLSMATAYDPMFDQQTTVVEDFAFWLTTMVFFVLGGHRMLIGALVESYHVVPMGHGVPPEMMLRGTLEALQGSFVVAVRLAAPSLLAFFLVTLSMGLMSRTIPQINMMTLGTGLHLITGMVMIAAGVTTWAMIANDAWMNLFGGLERMFSR